jgi:NADH:ubiquinone oxidoreductase subunit F (NADH-binding)/Pyruvate/2-oxoacid:ferredoxin oxidoreductase delta subunit/(2Fe-2S) ferredoxin
MKIPATTNLIDLQKAGRKSLFPDRIKLAVGSASCGLAAGAEAVLEALHTQVQQAGLDAQVAKTGCIGLCYQEPLVDIFIPGKGRFIYGQTKPDDVAAMVGALKADKVPEGAIAHITHEQLSPEPASAPACADAAGCPSGLPFFAGQLRIALRNCGWIDPESIQEYCARGGYGAFSALLVSGSPGRAIAEITDSGLRGRGGAGFSTGGKWSICRETPAAVKYIICNADEGDPGAYMDRSILEGDPHAVIEGMLIAGYAVGAARGFIYVRDEYPLAVKRIELALEQARTCGLLGAGIQHSDFSFDISISRGAGAFVCGEETALIKSIEGLCGEPVQRPPYPAISGLWGSPTVINNVETLATVPVIMDRGAAWFSSIGTEKSKGTKVFSLVGNISRTGLVEVAMGTTLREILYAIGGGAPQGRTCKAVQTGGPSGGCIPASLFDLPVDYEALSQAGSIMGSGGLIVMDDKTCMVDLAHYFLEFLEGESCGKCTPCRVGVRSMKKILEKISSGDAVLDDLSDLESLALNIRQSALCGLGRTAPNPVLSALQYFREEFVSHILHKKCPAGCCSALIAYAIAPEACTGCGLCLKACPAGAISGKKKEPHAIDSARCIKCAACLEACPSGAITT